MGIWGAGADAGRIVGAALRAGLRVTLCDSSREALVSALEAIGLAQETAVADGSLSIEARDADWARLTPALDPMALAGVEAVILTDAERPLAVDFARGLASQIAVLVAGGVPEGAGPDVIGVRFAQDGLVEVAVGDGITAATLATGFGMLRQFQTKAEFVRFSRNVNRWFPGSLGMISHECLEHPREMLAFVKKCLGEKRKKLLKKKKK